jgi:hypothetical protein
MMRRVSVVFRVAVVLAVVEFAFVVHWTRKRLFLAMIDARPERALALRIESVVGDCLVVVLTIATALAVITA